ncbi:hypothetical protein ACFYPA_36610 [Streptomyces sp. NPDC005775]|uniref:hypothetical protein n=1 Tax=Streptomyces sp. NPDC005775 TaxID=3364729 RepID=UPI00368193E6
MASVAQRAARPDVPAIPDGTYAAPDPRDPDTCTLWQVTGGELHAWPPRRRWAPTMPKPPAGLSTEERREQRNHWYAAVYWPWKQAVAAAILADLNHAADRFEQTVPEEERPDAVLRRALAHLDLPRVSSSHTDRVDQEQRGRARTAHVMVTAGLSYAAVARVFRVSKSTAWHWARQGQRLVEQRKESPGTVAAIVAALTVLEQEPDLGEEEPPAVQADEEAEAAGFAATAARVAGPAIDLGAILAGLDDVAALLTGLDDVLADAPGLS